MKKWAILFVFWFFPVLAQTFLPGTEDIPLMKGIKNVEESASFETPSERMVLIEAETNLPQKTVFNFYQKTLKNLDWKETKPGYFERGKDSFSIEITPHGQIQFRLSQSNL